MPRRSSRDELSRREAEALALLRQGAGTALTAETLADRHGCSLRQARRYVAVASLELVGELTPLALDQQAGTVLHRLDLVAGRAMLESDADLAIRASRAQAVALAQFRRAIQAPATRFRLPETPPEPPPDNCPF